MAQGSDHNRGHKTRGCWHAHLRVLCHCPLLGESEHPQERVGGHPHRTAVGRAHGGRRASRFPPKPGSPSASGCQPENGHQMPATVPGVFTYEGNPHCILRTELDAQLQTGYGTLQAVQRVNERLVAPSFPGVVSGLSKARREWGPESAIWGLPVHLTEQPYLWAQSLLEWSRKQKGALGELGGRTGWVRQNVA